MIHLATSLHCLGGLVVGLLAVPGILTQADHSAWVRPRGRAPILLTMWLGPLLFDREKGVGVVPVLGHLCPQNQDLAKNLPFRLQITAYSSRPDLVISLIIS